ncbi:MAG TPA: hypothetical protein VFB22_02285 [Candidatus Baltobacteraceae bacterium]|nr:hypothetical protein [Candidatus Baltobacteraceae bacterium]
MAYRRLATAAALIALLAGCGGGGGGSTSIPGSAVPQNLSQATPTPPTTTSSSSRATVTVAVSIPHRKAGGGLVRRPDYISSGTQAILFYDGNTIAGVINVNTSIPSPTATIVWAGSGSDTISNASCSAGATADTCMATVTTTIGAHTFGMVAYDQPVSTSSPSPSPTAKPTSERRVPDALYGGGVILSEGQSSAVTLQPGSNPGATITLNGVAAAASMPAITTPYTYNEQSNVGVVGVGTYTGSITIEDASFATITTPGTFDNGPVAVTEQDANGIVSITNGSWSNPPSTAGAESYTVSCLKAGTATLQATAKTSPNTSYVFHITYSSANYATSPIATLNFTCVANSASLPITGQ